MKKYLVVISFIITVVLNETYGFLEMFIKDPAIISLIKVIGAGLLAYLTPKGLVSKAEDIGGGGIRNPKP